MQLKPNDAHIWTAAIDVDAEQAEHLMGQLNQHEQARAKRLIEPGDQRQFIAAHVILRQVLSMYLDVSPTNIEYVYSEHKKPSLAHAKNLKFNMSHSGSHVAIAVTTVATIGIDIEQLTQLNKIAVAERYFSPNEITLLQKLAEPEQIAGFYHLWACKEAVIKANGKGLSIPLNSFSVSLAETPLQIELENCAWTIYPIDLILGYKAAVACSQPLNSATICQFSWQNNHKCKVIELK